MDQIPSSEPIQESSFSQGSRPGVAGWFDVWKRALTQPNEQTFIDITEDPNASTKTAYIWVFIAGTVSGIAQAFLQGIYTATGTTPTIPGLEEYMPASTGGDLTAGLITILVSICLSPVAGGLSVLFFALWTALIQWIAKLFGGTGNYDKLLYAFAAISAPFTMIASIITLFNAIPFVGACFGIVSFGLSIYVLVLQVFAVKGVNRLGSGQAVGALLIPMAGMFIICCCVVFGTAMVLGPVIGSSFGQFAP